MESATIEKPDLGESDDRPTKRQRTNSPPDIKAVSSEKVLEESVAVNGEEEASLANPLLPGLVDESSAAPEETSKPGDHLLDTLMRIVESQAMGAAGESKQGPHEEVPALKSGAGSELDGRDEPVVAIEGMKERIAQVDGPADEQTEAKIKEESPAVKDVHSAGQFEEDQSAGQIDNPSSLEKENGSMAAVPAQKDSLPDPAQPALLMSPDIATIREELPAINGTQDENHDPDQGEGAEWEVDSSPLSSDTSDDSSDSDSDNEVDDDYDMLDPEEQARILMEDGGSDDDRPAGRPKTQNEKPEEVIEKPDIQVTEDMKIEELGAVEAMVESAVLIKAKISGEYQVLESNSLLCLQDRTVIGVISETLGRVQQPLYTVRFTNDAAIAEAGLSEKGTRVFYVVPHSTFVFTQPLRKVKGSDASNIWDEEIGAHEAEFSDDEAEAEHKRELKLKKQGRRDLHNERNPGRGRDMNGRRGGRNNANVKQTPEMNYDDIPAGDDDGYTPLARPTNLHEMMGGEAPVEGHPAKFSPSFSPPSFERGRGRGRGDRSRGHRSQSRGQGRGRGWDRNNNAQPPFSQSTPLQPQPNSQAGTNGTSATFQSFLPPLPPISPGQNPYPFPQFPNFPTQNGAYQQQQQRYYSSPQAPQAPAAPTISPIPNIGSFPPFSPSPISPLPQAGLNFNYNPFAAGYQQQQQQQQHVAPGQMAPGQAGYPGWNAGAGGQMAPPGGNHSGSPSFQRGGRGGRGVGRGRG